jgi:hypothetical protein
MDFTKAVGIIGRDLEEALTMLDQLSEVPGSHIAETELAKSRIRSASDMLKLLPGLYGAGEATTEGRSVVAGGTGSATTGTVSEAVTAEKSVTATTEEERVTVEKIVKAAGPEVAVAEEKEVTAGTNEKEVTAEKKVTIENSEEVEQSGGGENAAPVPGSEPEKVVAGIADDPAGGKARTQESVKAILADRFGVTGTLGEKMSSSRKDEVVTSVMHSKPIADIAAAIGINDKFYYIRELFSGDAAAYSDAVSRLNGAASLGEAMKILDESTVMGSDPAAQSSFVDVVRRKFSLNV